MENKMSIPGNKKLYGTATVGTKGQIVIPADAREQLNIRPGDRLYVLGSMHGNGIVLLKEDMIEHIVEQMSAQIEGFREYQKNSDELTD
jgi:AbrB family looped-hinge helix DNA binding protein